MVTNQQLRTGNGGLPKTIKACSQPFKYDMLTNVVERCAIKVKAECVARVV